MHPSPHILIVEDSKTHQRIIEHVLRTDTDFTFTITDSLFAAREAMSSESFTAALLDIHLPDSVDGEIVDEVIKKKIPAILLTADVSEDTRRRYVNKAIVDFVNKGTIEDISFAVQLLRQIHLNREIHAVVAEDSLVTLSLLTRYLEVLQFQVHTAVNGQEAYRLAMQYKPQIVITDIQMPVMGGIELTRKLRREFSRNDMVILVVSADNDDKATSQLLKLGANDYIVKPVSRENFAARILLNIRNLQLVHNLAEANKKLQASNAKVLNRENLLNQYKMAIDRSMLVAKMNPGGTITYANERFGEIVGISRENLIGREYAHLLHEDNGIEITEQMWKTLNEGNTWIGTLQLNGEKNKKYYLGGTISPLQDESGKTAEYISIFQDITEIQELREYLQNELNVSVANLKQAIVKTE